MQNKQKSVEEEFTLVAPAALVCDEFVNSLLHLEKMPRVSSTMSSKALWLSQLQFYHEWNDLFLYHVANVFFFFFRLCWTRESILCQPLVATTGSAARALWYCWSYIHLHCAVLHIPDIISFLKCFEQCTTHRSALWEHRGIYWRSLVLPPHRGNTVACEREHIPLKRRGTPRTVKLFTVDRLVLQRRVVINATHLS